jgi:hypothetical protein
MNNLLNERTRKGISDFYREEFLRHKSRLETQKSFFADDEVYVQIEAALDRIIEEIDKMSQADNFQELAGHLLERIDVITSLSSSKITPTYRIH